MSQRAEECRNKIWAQIKTIVSSQMNYKLDARIVEGELKEALWVLPKTKCHGDDDLPVVCFWE